MGRQTDRRVSGFERCFNHSVRAGPGNRIRFREGNDEKGAAVALFYFLGCAGCVNAVL